MAKKMKCRHVKKMIFQYVDDELSPGTKRAIESHIRSCGSCRDGLEEAGVLRVLFSSAERFPAPFGFAARVLANIDEKEASRIRSLPGFRPLFLRATQVALALLVMTIGIVSGNLLLPEKTTLIGQTAVRQIFSLDLFQAAPPDSVGRIYNRLMRPDHER
jgi:anti-sigma factor RsiW